ncbi:MAG: hypothetical protein J0L88_08250 [Xanthomonadales bacterium]|nr:hypothetical protein [Xanthomonadales bacterium]
MPIIEREPLPDDALLQRHARHGDYTDCFATTIARAVDLEAFVSAFYTTHVFKLERAILRATIGRRSTDAEAAAFARGERDAFAAWTVVARGPDQLLTRDVSGHTGSWFQVESTGAASTRLRFGSTIIARRRDGEPPRIGTGFRALLGFHVVYSRVLLAAAARRLGAHGRR